MHWRHPESRLFVDCKNARVPKLGNQSAMNPVESSQNQEIVAQGGQRDHQEVPQALKRYK
jgi:hypothetical protein